LRWRKSPDEMPCLEQSRGVHDALFAYCNVHGEIFFAFSLQSLAGPSMRRRSLQSLFLSRWTGDVEGSSCWPPNLSASHIVATLPYKGSHITFLQKLPHHLFPCSDRHKSSIHFKSKSANSCFARSSSYWDTFFSDKSTGVGLVFFGVESLCRKPSGSWACHLMLPQSCL